MDSLATGNEIHWKCFLFFLHITLARPAGIVMWGSGTWYCDVILRFFSTARKPHQTIQNLVWNTVVQFNTIYVVCRLCNLTIIFCGICTSVFTLNDFLFFFLILSVKKPTLPQSSMIKCQLHSTNEERILWIKQVKPRAKLVHWPRTRATASLILETSWMAASINPKAGKRSMLLTQPHKILVLAVPLSESYKVDSALKPRNWYWQYLCRRQSLQFCNTEETSQIYWQRCQTSAAINQD